KGTRRQEETALQLLDHPTTPARVRPPIGPFDRKPTAKVNQIQFGGGVGVGIPAGRVAPSLCNSSIRARRVATKRSRIRMYSLASSIVCQRTSLRVLPV